MRKLFSRHRSASHRVTLIVAALVVTLMGYYTPPVAAQDPCSEGRLKDLQVAMLDCYGDQVFCSAGDAAAAYGSWSPLMLKFINVPDQNALVGKVQTYIKANAPKSPFTSNPQYVETIFTLGMRHDVNPLLVLSIAKQENQFGSVGAAAIQKNNYFGMTHTVNGRKEYRSFATPEEGIEFFVKAVATNITDQNGYYLKQGMSNFYEYLTIHQMGFIAYPGEYPKEPGASASPPYLFEDSLMNVRVDWNSPYAPTNYYKNSIAFINAITGMNLPDTPTREQCDDDVTGGGDVIGGAKGGIVEVNGIKYSFPLAPQTKRNYGGGGLPCNRRTCHHDGTPAFDLLYNGVAGKAIYAIVSGQVVKVSSQGGTCQSIQLKGDDGYFYWYGHVTRVKDYINVSKLPAKVKVGDQMGVVDRHSNSNNCNGTSGASHLHIDRGPKGTWGGSKCCRDPEFVPLLRNIYNQLPK